MPYKVKICFANLKNDQRSFSQMNPYVILSIGEITKTSKISVDGGKKPKWNQQFKFNTNKTNLKLQIKDEGGIGSFFEDVDIGNGYLKLDPQKYFQQPTDEIIDLTFQNKAAGKIQLKISTYQQQIRLSRQTSYQQDPRISTGQIAANQIICPTTPHKSGNLPPQNYPPHNYLHQSYPQQNYFQQSYPQQNYLHQSYPQQNYPPQNYQQQNYPQQNYPPQNYQQQNYPPQQFQNYPPQQQYNPQYNPNFQGQYANNNVSNSFGWGKYKKDSY